jgi:hypothetical protein
MRRSSGICQKCGTLVRRAARDLLRIPLDDEGGSGLPTPAAAATSEAIKLKDTLVKFDEESSARTTVIDDQKDYYDLMRMNAWLDEEEIAREVAREAAARQAAESTKNRVEVDLLGRRFVVKEDTVETETDAKDTDALGMVMAVAEQERPYGGARAVDGAGLRGGRREEKRSEAFMEFLKANTGGDGGLRFHRESGKKKTQRGTSGNG